ncbi:hypothetical protein D9M71_756640 [compost metagenome]
MHVQTVKRQGVAFAVVGPFCRIGPRDVLMSHQTERVGILECLACVTEGRLPIVVIEAVRHDLAIGHAAQCIVRDALRCTLVGDVNTAMPKPVAPHQVMP